MLKDKGVLLPIQEEALWLLGQLPEVEHFYLTGGTAQKFRQLALEILRNITGGKGHA